MHFEQEVTCMPREFATNKSPKYECVWYTVYKVLVTFFSKWCYSEHATSNNFLWFINLSTWEIFSFYIIYHKTISYFNLKWTYRAFVRFDKNSIIWLVETRLLTSESIRRYNFSEIFTKRCSFIKVITKIFVDILNLNFSYF